jgi:cytochrome d ubiquinol oxidase subunit II
METLWFGIVSFMIVGYVVFDGFDIGVGIVHLFGARSESERRAATASIAPVWDGNEVWLLAAGGLLYLAFPAVYARAFSGFYLPLMIVLWLLILRGLALELGGTIGQRMWYAFWDRTFGVASLLLAVFFGAALGNAVRGVPMDENGRFFEPLWTDFRASGRTGILDWYTVLAGVTAAVALTVHGACWLALRAEGELKDRSRRMVRGLWAPLGVLVAALTYGTFVVQPQVSAQLVARPWGCVFPLLAVASFVGVRTFTRRGAALRAFLASSAFLTGMLGSAVFGIYPYLLPSNTDPARGLSVWNSAAPEYGLRVALLWWIPGILLVATYFTIAYRRTHAQKA